MSARHSRRSFAGRGSPTASSDQLALAMVTTEKTTRMPMTIRTMIPWAFATAATPTTLSVAMARTIATVKALAQAALPSVNMSLA